MDINVLREIVTVVSFITFLGVVLFVLHPGNRKRFEQAGRDVLRDDERERARAGLGERE